MVDKVSIIIPAHNEGKVIETTLKGLIAGVVSGEFEVIVVCNGCTDNTAAAVMAFSKTIKCIETPIASKSNALNLGDSEAHYFPRIYQDADVVLSSDAIRQIAQVLRSGKYLAAAPEMQMDLNNASWVVHSYYEVWKQLPYVKEGMIGTGVYALSEEGRKRFGTFPQIIADDGYIRALFHAHERTSVDFCCSVVRAPTNINGLLKIKTRSRLGRYELEMKFPELIENEKKDYASATINLLKQINLWPKIFIYLYINLKTRTNAQKYARSLEFTRWERDESSREGG